MFVRSVANVSRVGALARRAGRFWHIIVAVGSFNLVRFFVSRFEETVLSRRIAVNVVVWIIDPHGRED